MFYWYDNVSNSFFFKDEINSSYIPQIVWVITDKCNYKCPFCFQPKTGTEICLEQLDMYIEIFKKLGIQKIDISGGEPLYFNSLVKVIETLKTNLFHVTISTNGSGLSSNRNWIVSNANIFSRIIISLNGCNEKQNNFLCGVESAYNSFLSFIELLKENRCENIRINTVISTLYLNNDNLYSIINVIKNILPYEWCLIQPHPENKMPSFDKYSINTAQFEKIVDLIKSEFLDTNVKIISRSIENYAGYWILNPDRQIILHTNGVRERIGLDLNLNSVSEIISLSKKYGLWLPTK